MINKYGLTNYLLCNSNLKVPLGNSHYITGKNILTFKNFACVEQNLNDITCKLKCMYNTVFNK